MDILKHNKKAWTQEVKKGNIWTRPVGSDVIERAKRGEFSLLLTPTKAVPEDWYPELRNKNKTRRHEGFVNVF